MIFRNQGSFIKKSNTISRDELIDIYGLNSYEFTQKNKEEILNSFRQRITNNINLEFEEAKKQVKKIASLRLSEIRK